MDYKKLNKILGNIDLYLLDQVLKGRFSPEMDLLDAGGGEGRNLPYFIHNNFNITLADKNPDALRLARYLYQNKGINVDNFLETDLENIPLPAKAFDVVLCIAVLHFCTNQNDFKRKLTEINRVMKDDGLLIITMEAVTKNKKKDGFFLYDKHVKEIMINCGFKLIELPKIILHHPEHATAGLILQKT